MVHREGHAKIARRNHGAELRRRHAGGRRFAPVVNHTSLVSGRRRVGAKPAVAGWERIVSLRPLEGAVDEFRMLHRHVHEGSGSGICARAWPKRISQRLSARDTCRWLRTLDELETTQISDVFTHSAQRGHSRATYDAGGRVDPPLSAVCDEQQQKLLF